AGLPTSFKFEQDAAIADNAIPAISQFGPGAPVTTTLAGMPYTIQSDGGNITLATGANVAGSALTLSARGTGATVAIDDTLDGANSLASLAVTASTIDVSGNITGN